MQRSEKASFRSVVKEQREDESRLVEHEERPGGDLAFEDEIYLFIEFVESAFRGDGLQRRGPSRIGESTPEQAAHQVRDAEWRFFVDGVGRRCYTLGLLEDLA